MMHKHLRLPALAAVTAQIGILVASPVVTGAIGPKWTAGLMIAAAIIGVLQAFQKPVKRERAKPNPLTRDVEHPPGNGR